MLAAKEQRLAETVDAGKLELYKLIEEGYRAMQDGRISTIEEVKERIQQRREARD